MDISGNECLVTFLQINAALLSAREATKLKLPIVRRQYTEKTLETDSEILRVCENNIIDALIGIAVLNDFKNSADTEHSTKRDIKVKLASSLEKYQVLQAKPVKALKETLILHGLESAYKSLGVSVPQLARRY